ncbi:unnamed protein product [Microthlaspi erraticum]|uniref:NYN domain-containing protein n=1 Tax=Microthlaspi erraticum TaxID=1685480 RepID=A0A6D2HGS6_9BRAS|nr:unnamed protein product [Microthlaspi erraticum]
MDLTPLSFCMGSTNKDAKNSTGVFWDLEDYPIPDHLDPATVVENIKLVLKSNGYTGDVFVWAYLPGGKTFSKHSVQEYKDAGITTITVTEEKYRRLHRMLIDFQVWSMDNRAIYGVGPNILVITKDMVGKKTSFIRLLGIFEEADYHVLWALPDDDTIEAPSCVKAKWHWRFLSGGGDPSVGDKSKTREEDICHNTDGQSM